MKLVSRALAVAALSLFAATVRADGFVNVYEIPPGVSMNVIGNQLTHEILNRTLHHWDIHAAEQKAAKAKAKSLGLPAGTDVAALLSQSLSSKQARSAEAAYSQAFRYHEKVIKQFGLPSGDLGVALASSIAGAWMAYHNKSFPDQFYVPLVRQMQQRVNRTPNLKALTATEREVAYKGLAIAGMILASSQISWERNPHAPGAADLEKRMRKEGGDMLTQVLRLPPERVGIGASGFVELAGTGG